MDPDRIIIMQRVAGMGHNTPVLRMCELVPAPGFWRGITNAALDGIAADV